MGLSMITAHFFVFYFACFSFVTPPVAIGALVGSRLAAADYTRSGLEACKVAFGGFVIPYIIVFFPTVTLQNTDMSFVFILLGFTALVGGLISLEIGFIGYFFSALPWLKRAGFIIIAAFFLLFVMSQKFSLFLIGGALGLFLGFWEWKKRRRTGPVVGSLR
jgi:TRAP-type uncharacterized transport system fused permease subunit